MLTGSEETTNSPGEASAEQGTDSAETTSQVASRREPQEGVAPAHGPTETASASTLNSSSTSQVESKQNLVKAAETLLEDAGQGATDNDDKRDTPVP